MRVCIHLCLSMAVSVCLCRSVSLPLSLSPFVCVSCVERRIIDALLEDARLRKANEPQRKRTQLVIRLPRRDSIRVSSTDTLSLLRKNTATQRLADHLPQRSTTGKYTINCFTSTHTRTEDTHVDLLLASKENNAHVSQLRERRSFACGPRRQRWSGRTWPRRVRGG